MDSINSRPPSSASVFDASVNEPYRAATYALEDIEQLLVRYRRINDLPEGLALLSEIEALRRFVLVRPALARALARPGRKDRRPMGVQICEALKAMIGDVPGMVKAYAGHGARNLERDTRRAIASLIFICGFDRAYV